MDTSQENIKFNLNNVSHDIDHSNVGKDERKTKLAEKEEDVLQKFIRETEEINDIVIMNEKAELHYLFSRNETLDEEYLESFKEDFQTVHDYFYSSILSTEQSKQAELINEFLYQHGISILKRQFNFTRICLPFLFARDLKNEEEMTIIKLVNTAGNKNYLIYVTYFPEYSSALIISYLKTFFSLFNKNFRFDDDFSRYE